MKAIFSLLTFSVVLLRCDAADAPDLPPDLVESVAAATLPAVTFSIKRDGLTLTASHGSDDFGEAVRRGQSFTIKDGELLRLYDRSSRTSYEIVARLADKPPVLWIRTTTRTGKDDGLGLTVGGSKVRVSTIPIK